MSKKKRVANFVAQTSSLKTLNKERRDIRKRRHNHFCLKLKWLLRGDLNSEHSQKF